MEKLVLDKINVRLSKVILLKDAFSEETVTNGIQIKTSYGGRTVIKSGGYCLFLNMEQEEFEAEISSPIYQSRKLRLKADGGEREEEIFLYPSSAYPIKRECTEVSVSLFPEAVFWCHLERGAEACKLLQDYHKEEEQILIFCKGRTGIRKRNWYIRDKEKNRGEYFQIREGTEESESCILVQSLKNDYRKKDAALYPAFECMAGGDGICYLLFDRLKEETYQLYYSYMYAGKEVFGNMEILGRKMNRLNVCKEG